MATLQALFPPRNNRTPNPTSTFGVRNVPKPAQHVKLSPPPSSTRPIYKPSFQPHDAPKKNLITKQEQEREDEEATIRDLKLLNSLTATVTCPADERFKRYDKPPENNKVCAFITQDPMFKTQKDDNPVVSWCVPHNKTQQQSLHLCFYVREVQAFIKKHMENEETKRQTPCPMFARTMIQTMLTNNGVRGYEIPTDMPDDFRVIFEEYDASHKEDPFGTVKIDYVMKIVLEYLQEYLKKMYEKLMQVPAANWGAIPGFFWKATVASLSFLGKSFVGLASWLLNNPYWMRIASTAAFSIRIAICCIITFGFDAVSILESLVLQFGEAVFGNIFPLFYLALQIIQCYLYPGFGCVAAMLRLLQSQKLPNGLFRFGNWITNSFSQVCDFIGGCVKPILATFNLLTFAGIFQSLTVDLSSPEDDRSKLPGLDYSATTQAVLKSQMQQWSTQDKQIRVVLFIIRLLAQRSGATEIVEATEDDTTITSFMPSKLLEMYRKIKQTHKRSFFAALSITVVQGFKMAEYAVVVSQFCLEMYTWITDFAPCLMDYVTRFFTATIEQQTFAPNFNIVRSCCLTPLIQSMTEAVHYAQMQRNINVKREVLNQKRDQASWLAYLASGGSLGRFFGSDLQTQQRNIANEHAALNAEMREHGVSLPFTTVGVEDLAKDNEAELTIAAASAAAYSYLTGPVMNFVSTATGATAGAIGAKLIAAKAAIPVVATAAVPALQYMASSDTMRVTSSHVWVFLCLPQQQIDKERVFAKYGIKRFELDNHTIIHLYCVYNQELGLDWVLSMDEMRQHLPHVLWTYQPHVYVLIDLLPPALIRFLIDLQTTPYTLCKQAVV